MVYWLLAFLVDIFFWFWFIKMDGINSWIGKTFFYSNPKFNQEERNSFCTIIAFVTIFAHTVIFVYGLVNEDFRDNYLDITY
ncbi:MAG: hypothetical protein K9K67_15405 [Bacteriovoracaceae bacterium]|nr:hypothetical protein [Bacteriovoracaceae bacterium]